MLDKPRRIAYIDKVSQRRRIMREERKTHVIDPAQAIALLDVDSVLDNRQYRWCPDEVTDGKGRWLDDDELTYDQFTYGPDYVVPAGSKIRMDYLWGYIDNQISGVVDYEITIPRAATMKHIVHVILSVYHGELQKNEEGFGRFYFIEAVEQDEDGVYHIHFGT